MKMIEAIILGIVQGFTEFIPVSSSGHLVLLSKIMGIQANGITFDIILHVATLFSVLVIFRQDIHRMIRKPFSRSNLLIIVATIPTIIIYILFKDFFLDLFKTGTYLGFSFIFTGIVLFLSGSLKTNNIVKDKVDKISLIDAAFIGTAQGIAMIPGVSRSGTTLAAGLARKIDGKTALRFTFLLSIPAVLGALASDAVDIYKGNTVFEPDIFPLIAGSVAAFICGYLAIRFMMKVILKKGIKPFAYYLWILGTLVLLDQYILKIFL
jgi:undecaprenyl-diphosphatase